MRFRKGRGKKKPVVTMTEEEVVDACYQWLAKKLTDTEPANMCWLKINTKEGKQRTRIEFVCEVE